MTQNNALGDPFAHTNVATLIRSIDDTCEVMGIDVQGEQRFIPPTKYSEDPLVIVNEPEESRTDGIRL